ncbi:MAG: HAD family phosphatase [Bauldia sp.]|nr:HAD family phosphatase [Bauldia sp.]
MTRTAAPIPKLVIFDCDGVLVDTEATHCRMLAKNLARHGLAITPEECMARFVGSRMATIGERAVEMGADLPEDWIDEAYGEIFPELAKGVPVIDGVIDVLDVLDARRIPYCVASNGNEEKMTITLGGNGILDRFGDRVFSAYTVGVWKPDPGLFLAAAARFGVGASECVVVEDSVTGATAAKRAGMRCFGYAPHGNGAGLAAQGATPFAAMAELPGLLGLDRVDASAQSARA